MKDLIIFGSAEIADLAYYYFKNDSKYRIVAFTVDDSYLKIETFNGLPIIPYSKVDKLFPPETHSMHVALSYARLNQLREEKFIESKAKGYKLATYVCSKSVSWPDLSKGKNAYL